MQSMLSQNMQSHRQTKTPTRCSTNRRACCNSYESCSSKWDSVDTSSVRFVKTPCRAACELSACVSSALELLLEESEEEEESLLSVS